MKEKLMKLHEIKKNSRMKERKQQKQKEGRGVTANKGRRKRWKELEKGERKGNQGK